MSGPILYPYTAPDGIGALIVWLAGIGNAVPAIGNITAAHVGPDRVPTDPLPYFMVFRPTVTDDKVTEYGVYAVQTFATASSPRQAMKRAYDAAMVAHGRILNMGPPYGSQQPITLPSGRVVQCDGVTTKDGPNWVEYSQDKSIQSYVTEYDIPWRFVAR